MIAIILDTETGQVRSNTEQLSSEYVNGNWSCDCNRRTLFEYLEPETSSTCIGCHRFIVVAAILFLPSDLPFTLSELNEGYDQELVSYWVNKTYEMKINQEIGL